jgi:SAM-dependent methyltransferase
MVKVISANWYDFPQYYDLAFQDETAREVSFFRAAFSHYARIPVRRVLEPACGSGRLVRAMAAEGYQVIGFDISRRALAYCRRRLKRHKLQATLFRADMRQFALRRPVDAAFNTFDSFRHLLTDKDALSHLNCMADAIRPGGLYIVGLHFFPPDAAEECLERWAARRAALRLTATLRVLRMDRRLRREWLRIVLTVRRGNSVVRIRHEFPLRIYTASEFLQLIRRSNKFELCEAFDFWYELEHPVEYSDSLVDTVVVLRRR